MPPDLKALSTLLDQKLKPLKGEILKLSEKIDDLKIELEDKISDVNVSVLHFKAEFKEESRGVKRRLNEIKKDQNMIIKFLTKNIYL